jgi:hypothetical protein
MKGTTWWKNAGMCCSFAVANYPAITDRGLPAISDSPSVRAPILRPPMIQELLFTAALLTAPSAVDPPDDPNFTTCVAPGDGVPLRWENQTQRVYLLVKRREGMQWKTWLKSYAKGSPFLLKMRSPQARNGQFAWMLFTVANGTFYKGEWYYFCTSDQ